MKILVTGATGQVGWRLGRALQGLGDVVLTTRSEIDLAQPDAIRRAIREARPDAIVNAAGYTHVDHAESESTLLHAVNAVAPGVIAQEAQRLGALFLHYSSVYVFDGTATRAYTEDDPPQPINAYGRSKLAGEQAIVAAGGANLILRASWVYDTRGRNFLLTMLKLARSREELAVVGDQTGSPTFARAIAEASAAILMQPDRAHAAPGIYNLASLGAVSRFDFTRHILEQVQAASGRPLPRLRRTTTAEFPLPAARPLNSVLDCSKLARTFDVPLTDWQTQLDACLRELTVG